MPLVHVARFAHTTGRYVIIEGDPYGGRREYLGAQKLMPGNQLNEMFRSFSADEITDLRIKNIEVLGPMGKPVSNNWEGYIT